MALTTTVTRPGRRPQVARGGVSGPGRATAVAPRRDGSDALDALVGQVLDYPDEVPVDVMAEAVRGLETLVGASLGETGTDARVLLQRRFARALGRSGWTGGGA